MKKSRLKRFYIKRVYKDIILLKGYHVGGKLTCASLGFSSSKDAIRFMHRTNKEFKYFRNYGKKNVYLYKKNKFWKSNF